MMRLMRLLKIFKERDKMAGYLNEFFKFNDAIERLFLFCVSFLLITHIVTCVWVMITQLSSGPDNWIYAGGFQDDGQVELYLTSFYYTITTITTVGYGDISPNTSVEKIFGIIMMCLGVVAFSFATGTLSSIMSNLDNASAKFREKLELLDQIKRDYLIGPGLYEEIRQAISFEAEKDKSNIMNFV